MMTAKAVELLPAPWMTTDQVRIEHNQGLAHSRKGALCAEVIRLSTSNIQTEETLSQNSLRYLSKLNVPIALTS